jgi:hypothetical protein
MQRTQERMQDVWRWSWLAGIYLAYTSSAVAVPIVLSTDPAAAALDTLVRCAASDSPPAQGLAALQAECPELEVALSELHFAESLQDNWRDSLTRDELNDLIALAQRYQTHQQSAAPALSALPDIFSELRSQQPAQPKSWWQAFKEWLRSFYTERPKARDASWLTRWFEKFRPSAAVTHTLVYALLGLVVVAAITVVINELRAAGILKRREKRIKPAKVSVLALPDQALSPIRDLDSAPLHDQPAILLGMLVSRLLDSGRLSVERFLTHRELAMQATFATGNERERFAQVARLAEHLLYGPDNTPDEQVLHTVNEGRALLQQWDASTP